MTDDNLVWVIASSLDHPSVYMGGPSPGAKIRAERLIESIRNGGYEIVPVAKEEKDKGEK